MAKLLSALVAVALTTAAVSAHHSFAAEYNANDQVTLVGTITKVEKLARPRFTRTVLSPPGRIVFGLLVVVFTIAAFVAPPFSGLDTLPGLGVVVISLGVLFGDAVIAVVGVVIGAGGIGLMIALAGAIKAGLGHIA